MRFVLSADPRFEGGGGSSKLNYDTFRKAYGFLGDFQDSEIEELKKSLKKEKNQVKHGVAPACSKPYNTRNRCTKSLATAQGEMVSRAGTKTI